MVANRGVSILAVTAILLDASKGVFEGFAVSVDSLGSISTYKLPRTGAHVLLPNSVDFFAVGLLLYLNSGGDRLTHNVISFTMVPLVP
jgi:hypothetical protein